MKTLRTLLVVAGLFIGTTAHAQYSQAGFGGDDTQENNPAAPSPDLEHAFWHCTLSFQAQGGGLQVIIGQMKLAGVGMINCEGRDGSHQELPVNITMKTTPIALNIGIGKFNISGLSGAIGSAKGIEGLLGQYIVARADAAIVVGAGAQLAVHGGHEQLAFNLGVNMLRGFGFDLGINQMMIEAAH